MNFKPGVNAPQSSDFRNPKTLETKSAIQDSIYSRLNKNYRKEVLKRNSEMRLVSDRRLYWLLAGPNLTFQLGSFYMQFSP